MNGFIGKRLAWYVKGREGKGKEERGGTTLCVLCVVCGVRCAVCCVLVLHDVCVCTAF